LSPNDDRRKFETVVAPYLNDAHAFARWLTRNRADAEDVVQEACIRAFRAIDRFSGSNGRAWLLTIVRNTAFTWLKEKRAEALVSTDELNEGELLAVDRGAELESSRSPEAEMIAAADADELERQIAALPTDFREVLVLRDMRGLDYREIAKITGAPIGTVMSRLARARQRLIGQMKQKGFWMAYADGTEEHLVHAYLDGELDVTTALMVERKIDADPELQKLAREISLLKKTLAEAFPSEPFPTQLRRRIESAVLVQRYQWTPRWALLAASVLVAVALSSSLTIVALRDSGLNDYNSELVDAHLRALMATQLIDVASSDQHTVKPWFNGRITQAPRVVDLHDYGFDLVGGRIDVVNNIPLPTLVYRKRQHVISLTDTTGEKSSPGLSFSQAKNGFNIIEWSDGGRSYVAVSDLNAAELESFAKLFRTAS
jgi:RNA polymerase sigma factor (sigma-70 family)